MIDLSSALDTAKAIKSISGKPHYASERLKHYIRFFEAVDWDPKIAKIILSPIRPRTVEDAKQKARMFLENNRIRRQKINKKTKKIMQWETAILKNQGIISEAAKAIGHKGKVSLIGLEILGVNVQKAIEIGRKLAGKRLTKQEMGKLKLRKDRAGKKRRNEFVEAFETAIMRNYGNVYSASKEMGYDNIVISKRLNRLGVNSSQAKENGRKLFVDLLMFTLNRTKFDKKKSAGLLGISLTSLNRHVSRFKITPKKVKNYKPSFPLVAQGNAITKKSRQSKHKTKLHKKKAETFPILKLRKPFRLP